MMALKIIKRLETRVALVHRFARGRAKLADHSSVGRSTLRASNSALLSKERIGSNLLLGRSDAIVLHFFSAIVAQPIGGPSGA